jgi:outer membrane lipoprotein SlyB
METQRKPIHPLMWVAGLALIVFCGAGIAAFMGWTSSSASKPADAAIGAKPDPARSARAPARTPVAAVCTQCGIVQSVNEVQDKGEGSGVGVVGGAVVGGALGNQVGHGDGRKLATVVGAVGGAVLGNEIERRVKSTKSYEVTVRFDDGTSRMMAFTDEPTWRPGDKVKVVDGVIRGNI